MGELGPYKHRESPRRNLLGPGAFELYNGRSKLGFWPEWREFLRQSSQSGQVRRKSWPSRNRFNVYSSKSAVWFRPCKRTVEITPSKLGGSPSGALGHIRWRRAALSDKQRFTASFAEMITVTPDSKELFGMRASVNGPLVFLDLFAIKDLAKGDPDRRRRFLATLDRGVEVMFSISNAAELSGPQDSSFSKIRSFLDEIGTHWFPAEFDPYVCMQREKKLLDPAACCFSEGLLKTFAATRINRSPEIQIVDLPKSMPSDFFRLGAFMDWLSPKRADIMMRKAELGSRLKDQIMEHWRKYKKDPTWLEHKFPKLPFKAAYPATFVHVNLVRLLILEAKSRAIMPNDGIDFGQAVIASAYASIATLDKHWKRRVEMLPKPNSIAKIYYQQELDKMVSDIETYLDNLSLRRARAVCSKN